jgi:outer membrane receptor protein involved in Fe transport
MKKSNIVFISILLGLFLITGSFPVVYAQENSSSEFTLEEITVTAEKRAENVQKTAVSITALDGDALLSDGRSTLQDILKDVPGLVVMQSVTNVVATDNPANAVTIRGVPSGGGAIGVSGQASTAYYVDGIYGGLAGDFDINRVEVLRGPQGTLYGRSATSGVVSTITNDPKLGEFGGDVTAEFGSYNLIHGQGALNVPIGDSLALRVSANHYQQDGVLSAEGTKQKKQTVRAKLLYQPNSDLSVLLGYVWRDDHDNSGGAAKYSEIGDPDSYYVVSDLPISSNLTSQRQVWAQLNWNIGIGTLTYIPSYRTYETSGTVSAFNGYIQQSGGTPDDSFVTHEVRLTSPDDSPLKWVVGGLSYRNELQSDIHPRWAGSGATVWHQVIDRTVTDQGLFAEATYPVAPTWRVTGGIRYDKSEVQQNQSYTQNTTPPIFIPGGPPDFTNPNFGLPENLVTGTLSGEAGNRKFNNVTFKARVEKDLTPENMLYAMISTGFLPGDINVNSFNDTFTVLTMDQQELMSFEIGSKNRFFDNRLQINGSAYYYDYEGYQQGANINPQINNAFVVLSSPARMWGFELETNYLLTASDRIDLSFGYTNAQFVDKPNTPSNPFATFVGQTDIPGIPPVTAALGYDHTFYLPKGSTIDFYNQLRYASGYDQVALTSAQLSTGAEPYIYEGATWLDDASLSWASSSAKYSATFYVHNVFDAEYKQGANLVTSSPPYFSSLNTTTPRTYGVVLSVRF